MSFEQRKKDVLSKKDKSSIGSWDKKIVSLCEKINEKENYYTTSSCSGRVLLMIDQLKKDKNLFLFIHHDLINFEKLKEELEKINVDGLIKFKFEPMILHVVCKSLEDANVLLDKARNSGFKKIGIINFGKNVLAEINSSERLEFPIMNNKKILVNDEFLKLIVEKSNNNLQKSWERLWNLEKKI